jgi:hypothetical protein
MRQNRRGRLASRHLEDDESFEAALKDISRKVCSSINAPMVEQDVGVVEMLGRCVREVFFNRRRKSHVRHVAEHIFGKRLKEGRTARM